MPIVKHEGKLSSIDVRKEILNGEHPIQIVFDFVRNTKPGTIIQIHTPHRAEPIIAGLDSLGMNVVVNEMEPDHYCIMCVKS